jgi:hypothetical protein
MLPPQHDELMPQDEQLNILRKLRTPTANDQPQQRREHQVDQGKNHRPILPNPGRKRRFERVTGLLKPFRAHDNYGSVLAAHPDSRRGGQLQIAGSQPIV